MGLILSATTDVRILDILKAVAARAYPHSRPTVKRLACIIRLLVLNRNHQCHFLLKCCMLVPLCITILDCVVTASQSTFEGSMRILSATTTCAVAPFGVQPEVAVARSI